MNQNTIYTQDVHMDIVKELRDELINRITNCDDLASAIDNIDELIKEVALATIAMKDEDIS